MILDDNSAEDRLNSDRNLVNRFGRNRAGLSHQQSDEQGEESNDSSPIPLVKEVVIKKRGNTSGRQLSPITRSTIALLAKSGENQDVLAKEFGVCQSEVHRLENDKVKGVDTKAVDKQLEKVRDVAIDRLMQSMGLISDEKLGKASAKDLATIAKNMSGVVKDSLPNQVNGPAINLTIYAPEQRAESNFKTVEV